MVFRGCKDSVNFRFLFLLVVLSFFCVSFVKANVNWWNYGNIGYSPSSNEGYVVFASHIPSFHNESELSSCIITGAYDFGAVSDDLDLDGVNEIVLVDGNKVDVYDTSCTFEDSFTVAGTISGMPVIYNSDGNSLAEIIVSDSSAIYLREYDSSTGGYEVVKTISNPCTAFYYFSCALFEGDDNCVGADSSNICFFDIDTGVNFYNISNPATKNLQDRGSGTVVISQADPYWGVFSYFNVNAYYLKLYSVNGSSGATCANPVFSPGSATYQGSNAVVGSLGSAKAGNVLAISSRHYNPGVNGWFNLCDIAGSNRVSISDGNVSNPMIGDYDGDGLNEICVYHNFNLSCYNNLYAEEFELTGFTHDVRHGVLADFDDSNDFLELVTPRGIYDISSGSPELILNNSAFSEDTGQLIVVSKDSTLTNVVVDVESAQVIIFGFGGGLDVVCGDGVCNGGETLYNCFEDCYYDVNASAPNSSLLPDGEACDNSSMCQSGFCLYGYCSGKSAGMDCTYDYECVSGSCVDGRCRKPSLWQNIDAGKDETFGDDVETNNLISICTMTLVGGSLVASGSIFGAVAGIGLAFVIGAFFTWVGWLSAWIFIVFIIVLIIGGVVVVLLKYGNG